VLSAQVKTNSVREKDFLAPFQDYLIEKVRFKPSRMMWGPMAFTFPSNFLRRIDQDSQDKKRTTHGSTRRGIYLILLRKKIFISLQLMSFTVFKDHPSFIKQTSAAVDVCWLMCAFYISYVIVSHVQSRFRKYSTTVHGCRLYRVLPYVIRLDTVAFFILQFKLDGAFTPAGSS